MIAACRKKGGGLIVAEFSSAPFPHPERQAGHTHEGRAYAASRHYRDSRVAVFVPEGFKSGPTTDLVFHFHGWYGEIEEALKKHQLAQQFSRSRRNAVLVVPQGPRNAPDSFFGKLEDKNGFRRLVRDVLRLLRIRGIVKTIRPGRIILSGHSGGYRPISFILMRGGLSSHIKEVYLFDALYGQVEKFAHWIDHHRGKLVAIYTPHGGTKDETDKLMADLDGWGVSYRHLKGRDASAAVIKKNRLVFIYSKLRHDRVVQRNLNFEMFLAASRLDNIK